MRYEKINIQKCYTPIFTALHLRTQAGKNKRYKNRDKKPYKTAIG